MDCRQCRCFFRCFQGRKLFSKAQPSSRAMRLGRLNCGGKLKSLKGGFWQRFLGLLSWAAVCILIDYRYYFVEVRYLSLWNLWPLLFWEAHHRLGSLEAQCCQILQPIHALWHRTTSSFPPFRNFQAETPDNLRAFELASVEAEGLTEAFSKVSFSVDHGGSRSLMRKTMGHHIYIHIYILYIYIYSTEILKSTTCAYNYSI